MLKVIRARTAAALVNGWWLATSSHGDDDITAIWGRELGFRVFRGEEEDVLSRFTGILRRDPHDWVVRLTADNPFVDAIVINRLVESAHVASTNTALIRDAGASRYPLGYVPEVVRADALFTAEKDIPSDQAFHRSHVTSWTASVSGVRPVQLPKNWPTRPDWRWTVDTMDDYLMAVEAFSLWTSSWPDIDYPRMVASLDANPSVFGRNMHVAQKDLLEG